MTVTIDQAEVDLVVDAVRDAMRQFSTSDDVRVAMSTSDGYDRAVWRRLATELGLAGLAVPDRYGGAGCGNAELSLVFEQTGAALLCSPLFATAALALPLLSSACDETALDAFAPRLAAGELTATVALFEDNGEWPSGAGGATAALDGGQWLVTGTKNYVIDGATADVILLAATTFDGPALFAVPAGASGLDRQRLVSLDQTRKLARLTFSSTPARRIDTPDALSALDHAIAVGRAMMAAEQAGGAQRCLELTTEQVTTRYQFARPVGSFQMVKERLADMLIRVESARSAAHAAARAVDGGDGVDGVDGVARTTLAARIVCNDAYIHVTDKTIQLHGGIGFTWEHDAHLYFKRARSSAQLLGDTSWCVESLAANLSTEFGATR